jgi:pimeloyl-ACP methyl ester carboxylesterase
VRFVELSYPRTTVWNLNEYADAIEAALAANGVGAGWLLAESWGSQPGWQMADRSRRLRVGFRVEGMILAGGFVRHPWPWAVDLTEWCGAKASMSSLNRFLKLYPLYARYRLRHAPETLTEMPEFLARRTEEDRRAAVHRLRLIRENDLSSEACAWSGPLHCLTGGIDPVVPWPWVIHWLRKNSPGYRGARIFLSADHNVLNSRGAAEQVLVWMGQTG